MSLHLLCAVALMAVSEPVVEVHVLGRSRSRTDPAARDGEAAPGLVSAATEGDAEAFAELYAAHRALGLPAPAGQDALDEPCGRPHLGDVLPCLGCDVAVPPGRAVLRGVAAPDRAQPGDRPLQVASACSRADDRRHEPRCRPTRWPVRTRPCSPGSTARSSGSRCLALPPDQRRCLMLRYFEGFSIATTAEILGRSQGAVKQLQWRGLRNLSKSLAHLTSPR